MGAPSKRAKKIRSAGEFDIARLRAAIAAPKENAAVFSWSLAEIYNVRNAQMRGDFRMAARAAESMRTDDAIFVARQNRLAPEQSLKIRIAPAPGARGVGPAKEAEALFGQDGAGMTPETRTDLHGCLVEHGIAIGYNIPTPREDGTRVDFEHRYWPIEFVRWDEYRQCLFARVDPTMVLPDSTVGGEIPIIHGDGRWAVYQKSSHLPWRSGALVAALLVWARHAFANRDWSKGSLTHGLAKVIGELPEGVPLQAEGGGLTAEAAAFQELLLAIANSDLPVGIRPSKSTTEFVSNSSSAWEIFAKLVENAEKSAARIYLGTDGILGAQGGAPGVDISELFGVASTLIQGDLECIKRCFGTGVLEPWCAVNFGDSSLAPTREYVIPDPDEDRAAESLAKKRQAFYGDLKAAKDAGVAITQAFVDTIAKEYGVEPVLLAALES